MIDDDLAAAFEATWPAAGYAVAGGLTVGRGLGGGGRVGSARRSGTAVTAADVDRAIAIQRGWDQPAQVRAMDDDAELIALCRDAGLRPHTPTAILHAPIAALTDRPVPPVTAFAVWPPMAIQRDLWARGAITPARQAVMARVTGPRAALLARVEDRAAGAGFVAVHGTVAMLHALEIAPGMRRKGAAGWLIRHAAHWAAGQGADRLALAVSRANAPAHALYAGLGFAEAGGYAYHAA